MNIITVSNKGQNRDKYKASKTETKASMTKKQTKRKLEVDKGRSVWPQRKRKQERLYCEERVRSFAEVSQSDSRMRDCPSGSVCAG